MRSLQQANCLRYSELVGRSACLGVLRYPSCSWGWHPVLQHFSPKSNLLIAAAVKAGEIPVLVSWAGGIWGLLCDSAGGVAQSFP